MESAQVTAGLAELSPGPELAAALATVDLSEVPNGEIIAVLQARSRQRAHEEAQFLAVVAEVGRRDPDAGLDEVARLREPARFGADETRCALAWTRRAAEVEHDLAEVLTAQLPEVLAALNAGWIDRPKARVFVDHLADLAPMHVDTICRVLLPEAGGLTTGQLRVRLARLVIATDPERARDQYERAVRERAVIGYLNPDGTATITAQALPADQAAAAYERLDGLARAVKRAGHAGSLDQIRADLCLGLLDGSLHGLSRAEIIARLLGTAETPASARDTADEVGPAGGVDTDSAANTDNAANTDSTAGAGRAPGVEVRVQLSTLLGYDEHPGEIPGWGPVPAHVARRIVACQRGGEWCFAVTDSRGYLVCGGITRRRPHGITDARDGGVVELQVPATLLGRLAGNSPTGWAGVIADIAAQYASWPRRVARLDSDPGRRLPTAGQRRYVRLRDRCCRGPGCRRPPGRCDLDHSLDYQHGGSTSQANTGPVCKHDHDLKHKGGWRLEQPEPGVFVWLSPLGRLYRTRGDPIIPLDEPEPEPEDDDPPF